MQRYEKQGANARIKQFWVWRERGIMDRYYFSNKKKY